VSPSRCQREMGARCRGLEVGCRPGENRPIGLGNRTRRWGAVVSGVDRLTGEEEDQGSRGGVRGIRSESALIMKGVLP
jgi:hypothetical protein